MFAVLRQLHGQEHWDEIHNSFATRDEAIAWLEAQLVDCCTTASFRVVKITDEFVVSKVLTRL